MSLDGFTRHDVTVDGVRIAAWVGGSGPPVLLLHGYPQTHAMWEAVAPALSAERTVVVTDLRGYGDSDKPPGGADHAGYAKRTMAADQVGVMAALGFERFALVGHDRGARVAHRAALDHPDRITRLAVLDIAPTHYMLATADRILGLAYFHWFFLAQPPGLPEAMIESDPTRWLMRMLGEARPGGSGYRRPEAIEEYTRAFLSPGAITAGCEDYRAGVGIDFDQDEADRARRVRCPLLVLWGADGFIGRRYDPLAVWREYADDVRGQPVGSGHYLPEEDPAGVLGALTPFLDEIPDS
jgi:haloacetate dehalogenase